MRCSIPFRIVLVGLALLVRPPAAAGGALAFGTTGGDAWTFVKPVDVQVTDERCDHVAVSSPLGTVVVPSRPGDTQVRVPLKPGENVVEAECREHGAPRGESVRQEWRVRLRNVPTARIRVSVAEAGVVLDASESRQAPVQPSAIEVYQWRARAGSPAVLPGLPSRGSRIVLPTNAPDGEYYVTLKVTDAAGRADESTAMFRLKGGRPEVVDPGRDHAAWIDRAVIYGVVPKLFGPRGLSDVTARLDRLAALGINTLWLSPITDTPPGDFGYAVTDYFRIRPDIGKSEDFRQLIAAAHARGMRVIIDFAPNHLSEQNAYFADTIAHGRSSPYFDFFSRDPNGEARHYFEWQNLKNLNYRNSEVQRLIIEAFSYWVREFDVDGFRVDAAWGPRERAPDFWPRWRAELKRIKPDLLLLAEASVRDPYYGRNGFDVAYDWSEHLGHWAWRDAFEHEADIARRLRAAIERSISDILVFRFLDNNDTGARFIARYGIDRLRVATAMLFTLPGIPSVYTGEEVGAVYQPYRDTKPIDWRDRDGLETWYARLAALRREHPALRSRAIRMLAVAPEERVLAYERKDGSGERILVLLNFGTSLARVQLPADAADFSGSDAFLDLLTGEAVRLDGDAPTLTLGADAVRILKAN
ncbi:MAG TPA: alpha-amylase family glycosyl hydrolase [Xanthobacteraceae bacterium]|nr:alpha-amylase family glycosyl hydrolase [Xanthobacteraceae bacterium]